MSLVFDGTSRLGGVLGDYCLCLLLGGTFNSGLFGWNFVEEHE